LEAASELGRIRRTSIIVETERDGGADVAGQPPVGQPNGARWHQISQYWSRCGNAVAFPHPFGARPLRI
jgi:hypothetical protein